MAFGKLALWSLAVIMLWISLNTALSETNAAPLVIDLTTVAFPKFLTLPFSNSEVELVQSWTYSGGGNHLGIDYINRSNLNFPILASASGMATFIQGRYDGNCIDTDTTNDEEWGDYVFIDHGVINGYKYFTLYAHLESSTISRGQTRYVNRGDIIGIAGTTGDCDGPIHLHFEFSRKEQNASGQGYGPGFRYDPYDLYAERNIYPGFPGGTPVALGTNHAWVQDPPVRPSFITLFTLKNYSVDICCGDTVSLWDVRGEGLADLTLINDVISSIWIPDWMSSTGWSIKVFEHAGGGGGSKTFTHSDADLSNDFYDGAQRTVDNSISSIAIYSPYQVAPCSVILLASQDNLADIPSQIDNLCNPPTPLPTDVPGGSTPTPPPPSGINWSARYFDGSTCWFDTNCPIQPRCTSTIGGPELHADYGTGAPCSGMSSENWVGDYSATLNFPAGDYVFQLINDDGAKVWLNGVNIQDRGNSSSDPVCPARHLDGNANLRVMLREDGGDAKVHLTWTTDTRMCDGGTPATGRWQVKYFNYDKNNPSSKSECTPNSSEASFDGTYLVKDWRNNSPGGTCNADFVAEITGKMLFEANKQYTFHLNADDSAWLEVYGHTRGNLVIDLDPDDRTSPPEMTSPVEAIQFTTTGERDIRLYFRDNSGDAIVQAWWEGPGLYPLPNDTLDPQQWFVEYWQNRHLWADSVARRNEGMSDTIDYLSWGMNGPGFGIGSDQFSVQFRRTVPFACGNYRFVLDHDDGVRFYVDDILKLDRWIDGGLVDTVDMFLPQGNHNLKIQHYENTGAASFRFDFSRLNTSGCTVDLNTVAPSGWTAPVFLSSQPGTLSNSTLTVGQPVYVDIGYQNSGTSEAASHFVDLLIDGVQYRREWVSILTSGNSMRLLDLPIVVDTIGTHMVQVILDPASAISESNEANNTWSGQFTWQAAPTPTNTPTSTNTPIPVTPTPVYGSGRDGDLVVAAGQTYTFCDGAKSFCTWMENGASAGQPTIVVNSTSGLAVGDEVLIIHIRHLANHGAGNYEFATISAIGGDGKTITLNRNLTNSYDTSVTHIHSRVQVVKVPHFNNVTIQSSGTFGVRPWNDRTGGVVAMRVAGQLVVQGTLDVKGNPGPFNLGDGDLISGGIGAGFAGGKSRNQHQQAYQGEGDVGPSYAAGPANGTGGGGAWTTSTADSGSSGGGGSHASAGTNGTVRGSGNGGEGANRIVGNAELTQLFFGGGGGGGSMDQNAAGGPGGAGGGIAVLFAKQLSVTGTINASGGDGGYSFYSSGGGGAGGSILIKSDVVNLGSNLVTAKSGQGWAKSYSTGGNGGNGRIRIEYGTQLTGNTFPAASTVQAAGLVPTATSTRTPAPTNTATSTQIPPTSTNTPTQTSTSTPVPPTATYTKVPPTATSATSIIFADGFESGSLSAWSANKTDSGDLAVSNNAALVGTKGLQALIDDNIALYVTDEKPNQEMDYRARFYFDPNSIPMAANNAHILFYGYHGTSQAVLQLELRFQNSKYQLRGGLLNDSTTWTLSNWVIITDTPHFVEFEWHASTAIGVNNGSLKFWVDEQLIAQLSLIDNDTRRIDQVRLGPVSGIDNGTRGTYYFDAFESRRASHIGPVVLAQNEALPSPLFVLSENITQMVLPDRAAQISSQIDALGVNLTLPANSVEAPVTVVLTGTDYNTMPDGYSQLGVSFEIQAVGANGEKVQSFLQDYDLNVSFESDRGDSAESFNYLPLTFQAWNPDSGVWEIVPSSLSDTQNSITVHLDRPGTFAIFQVEPKEEEASSLNVYLPVIQR